MTNSAISSGQPAWRRAVRPLTECRVLDLGIITAGAATSAVLADLGAEVIKIESPSYKDPFRKWDGRALEGEHPDLPPFFRMTNRGKLNLGVDLKNPAGREVFLRLVKKSDVVVENFSRGVMSRLGLDYRTLKSVNPDIVLASISSQGESGPDAAYVSFGSTLEAMGGLAALTGYANGPPTISGIDLNYPDQVAAIFAAGMIVTAWHAKERGEGGVHLDLSQRELTSFLCGDVFVAPRGRQGNADDNFALQDCFRSHDGLWIAMSVKPEQSAALQVLAGGASSARVDEWVGRMRGAEVLEALRLGGIAAAQVASGNEVLAARGTGWARAFLNSIGGPVKGVLFDSGRRPAAVDRPAALLGADSREVLSRIGGCSEDEIEELVRAGVVSVVSSDTPPSSE